MEVFNPHSYQVLAIQKAIDLPSVGLFMKPGLGKTVVALTALEILIHDRYQYDKALVIAPKRVCEDVWPSEIEKWSHLSMSYSLIIGPKQARRDSLRRKADIYIISRDNLVWLVKTCLEDKCWPFKVVVIDELSNFKDSSTQRFRALRQIRSHIDKVIGLTGTPRPNTDMDLWAQAYLLDKGERLGRTITSFRQQYFYRPSVYMPYKWVIKSSESSELMQRKLSDICISMTAEDYLSLPGLQTVDREINLPEKTRSLYQTLQRDMVLELSNKTVTATSKAIVINKLLQFTGGSVYDDAKRVIDVHDLKLETLINIIEESGDNESVLVFYQFKHELSRITKYLKVRGIESVQLKSQDDIDNWNRGSIRVLLAHPMSCGYGLNLQAGGHTVVWFTLTWSQEQYEQANARLYRQGQKESVIIHRLIVRDTVDEIVRTALEKKRCGQEELFDVLKAVVTSQAL